jgi:hypothetical protein
MGNMSELTLFRRISLRQESLGTLHRKLRPKSAGRAHGKQAQQSRILIGEACYNVDSERKHQGLARTYFTRPRNGSIALCASRDSILRVRVGISHDLFRGVGSHHAPLRRVIARRRSRFRAPALRCYLAFHDNGTVRVARPVERPAAASVRQSTARAVRIDVKETAAQIIGSFR